MAQPIAYFARTLHGLEEHTWRDIASHTHSKLIEFSHRSIEFSSLSDPSELLHLRSVEDIFVLAAKIVEVSHERASLKLIEEQLSEISYNSFLDVCRSTRDIAKHIRFSVTASFVGSRNYNRWELAEAVAASLTRRHSWEYVDTRAGGAVEHNIHLRLVLEADHGLLGLRLGNDPLHKRPYKQMHLQASLNPILAYHMIRLAQVRENETILDPMCGVGTIPIEAACAEPDCFAVGLDLNPEAVAATRENALLANAAISVAEGNAMRTALESHSVDAIVCDLPWGGQSELVGGSLQEVSTEFHRLLKPGGRLVLLTEQPDELRKSLEAASFIGNQEYIVSLHGKHPTILVSQVPPHN